MNDLKLTIITATFNSEKFLEQTIRSVVSQTYKNIEYIIVDGASKDGTLDIVKKYETFIHKVISEPDRGIYDAFNKGIDAATGDVIYFLNSDDYLHNDDVIWKIMNHFRENESVEAVYGNIWRFDPETNTGTVYGKPIRLDDFKNGYMPPHQGLFMRKELFSTFGPFELKYKSSSDFDFILKCFLKMINKALYVNMLVACFRIGGASTGYETRMKGLMETEQIIKERFGVQVDFSSRETINNALYREWLESLLLLDKGITRWLKSRNIRNVAVFGTLKTAHYLYADLTKEGFHIVAFIDNNEHMHGKEIKGINVHPSSWLSEQDRSIDAVILSVENSRDGEIMESLRREMPSRTYVVSWKQLVSGKLD